MNIETFLSTRILKDICERLLLVSVSCIGKMLIRIEAKLFVAQWDSDYNNGLIPVDTRR